MLLGPSRAPERMLSEDIIRRFQLAYFVVLGTCGFGLMVANTNFTKTSNKGSWASLLPFVGFAAITFTPPAALFLALSAFNTVPDGGIVILALLCVSWAFAAATPVTLAVLDFKRGYRSRLSLLLFLSPQWQALIVLSVMLLAMVFLSTPVDTIAAGSVLIVTYFVFVSAYQCVLNRLELLPRPS